MSVPSDDDTYTSGYFLAREFKDNLGTVYSKLMGTEKLKSLDKPIQNLVIEHYVKSEYDEIISENVEKIRGILNSTQVDILTDIPSDPTLSSIGKINGIGFKHARENANYNLDLTGEELKQNIMSEFNKAVVEDFENSDVMPITEAIDTRIELVEASKHLDQFTTGKHGDMRPKVNKVYNINMDSTAFKAFIEKDKLNPRSESKGKVETFMIHGTGSIAAAFISKFGFRDIPEGVGIATTGKMLGPGIYLAKDVDKSLSYIGDAGYSKGKGSEGYMFECQVCLGEYGVDFKDGRGHKLVSPEWVAKKFQEQILVTKLYKLEIMSSRDFDKFIE